MLLFLKIVLAVILVLGGLAISLFWWVKRRIGRSLINYSASYALVNPRWQQPARLRLSAGEDEQCSEAMKALWREIHAQGFERLVDLTDAERSFATIRIAVKEQHWAAAIVEAENTPPTFALFALSTENRLWSFGNGPEPALTNAAMHWEVDSRLDPATALEKLQAASSGQTLRPIDRRTARAVYERAYAARIDAQLRLPFVPAEVEREAAAKNPRATPEQLSQAVELSRNLRNSQLQEAILDQYRRTSKIDAVRWEEISENLHVIHSGLSEEDLLAPFHDYEESDRIDQLSSQMTAQGYSGQKLFEQISAQLGNCFQRIGSVERPVSATIYAADRDAPDQGSARMHLYQAQDAEDRPVSGALLAANAADAKAQMAAMGLQQGKIIVESTGMDSLDELIMTPREAAIAARANRESILVSALRALWGNALLWLPPTLIAGWNLYWGTPFGWGDYLSFVLATAAVLLTVAIVAPMILYHQLLKLRCQGRWRQAQWSLNLLRRFNWLGSLPKMTLDIEQAKLMGSKSDTAAAVRYWEQFRSELSEEQFLGGLVQIHDSCGQFDEMIQTQRRMATITQTPDLVRIDLAMALSRYQGKTEEAENLLAQISAAGLSEVATIGYHFTRGLICEARAQHQHALNQYAQAVELTQQFRGNPLVQAITAEINGYIALSLKRSGELGKADQLWQRVRPLIEPHPSGQALIRLYES
ncbi:MAG: hypothetical protein KDI71_14740 [Xanthomonadales bacterium]|nr:hypothetical protein [Xanthomonadales bacterium]